MQLSMRRLLFFTLTLSPVFSHAQFLLDTVHIEQVNISARRTVAQLGLVTTSIDSVAMSQAGSQNIGELLSLNSPLYIKSYGGSSMATASFRGTAASHTQVVWNGMPINSASNGITDLSLLPGVFTDQVTLLHGGSSLSQGTGSLGGSILIDNKPQWNRPVHVEASLGAGSFGTHKLLLGAGFGKPKWQYSFKTFNDLSDNDYTFRNDEVLPLRTDTLRNGGYKKIGVMQELYAKTGERTVLSLQQSMSRSHRDLPPLMSYEGNNVEWQEDDATRSAIQLQHYGARWQTRLMLGTNVTHSEYQYFSPERDWVINDAQSDEMTISLRLELKETFAEKRGLIQYNLGTAFCTADTYSETRKAGYEESRAEYDAGVSVHYRFAERLGGYALVRGEYYDQQAAPLTPSLGLDYQMLADKPLIAKLSASRNYHKPTLNDLYYLPGGNPDLKPEDGYSADATLDYSHQGKSLSWQASTNLYISRISNWIVWEPARSGASYQEATNLREVFARGSENQVSASMKHDKWNLSLHGLYTYTRTENISARSANDLSAGKQLMYIPIHTGGATMTAKYRAVHFGITEHYTGQRFATSSNDDLTSTSAYQPNLPGYWLTGAFAGFEYSHTNHQWICSVKADNLFSADYKAVLGRPMPKRSFWLSLSWKWAKG